jgi:hypothetical protein
MSSLESSLISFVFNEETWRSAVNVEEINKSNTKVHSYFEENIVEHNNFPRIRQDLIMNRVNIYRTIFLDIPADLDENIAYVVYCEHGDYFLK